jgi:hypothetical protein
VDVLLGEPGDQILTDDTIQGPALVAASYLLPHGCQKALGIEETCDPKHLKNNNF